MAYDVFLVSAIEDRDAAKVVARRLRALKFKVYFDQKQTDDTFTDKDARNAMNSQSMLVLWSDQAVESDWVRAAASIGHSRPGVLIQAGLDKTIPYEPFKQDKRYSLEGLTARKIPVGFYEIVEELEQRHGRSDLRAWMGFGRNDEDEKADWLAAHPEDPLAIDAEKKRQKALGKKPAPAAEAKSAAALAAAALRPNGNGNAGGKGNGATQAPQPAPKSPLRPPPLPQPKVKSSDEVGQGTLVAVLAAIAAMLVLSWVFRTETITAAPQTAMPGVGNAYVMSNACPAGQVPASLVRVLEPGPIINDTLETGVIVDDTKDEPSSEDE